MDTSRKVSIGGTTPRLLSLQNAARVLGVSDRFLRILHERGQLRLTRLGRRVLVPQLLIGGAITVVLSTLGWLFVTVIGMNREIGEVRTDRAALEDKLQDIKVSIGSLNQEHTRALEDLDGRLDRLDRRVDALARSGSAQNMKRGH